MLDLPKSPKEARALGAKHYCTGKPCSRGHLAKRFTSAFACEKCHVEIERQRRSENPQRHRDTVRRYMNRNSGLASERAKIWRAANPEKKIAYARKVATRTLGGAPPTTTHTLLAFVGHKTASSRKSFNAGDLYRGSSADSHDGGCSSRRSRDSTLQRRPTSAFQSADIDPHREHQKRRIHFSGYGRSLAQSIISSQTNVMPKVSEWKLQRSVCIWLNGNRDTKTKEWRNPPALIPNVVFWHTANNAGREEDAGLELKWSKEVGLLPGVHDLFFLRPTRFQEGIFGLLFGMELKKPGGKQPPSEQLSESQRRVHPKLLAAGLAASVVIDNLADAKAWLIAHQLALDL